MSTSETAPDQPPIDDVAADWLCEKEEGFAPGREQAFADWCALDPLHAQAVVRMERTLGLLKTAPALGARIEARIAEQAAEAQRPRRRVVSISFVLASAGLAAALLVGVAAWRGAFRPAPAAQHFVTDARVQRSLALPDGSVMDLNLDSEVTMQFTAGERRVTLLKGEAHFQVAHDKARPFIVTSGDVSVRAVGTAFDVRLADRSVQVLVVEGKVQLAQKNETRAVATPDHPPLLLAGERVQVRRDRPPEELHVEKVDAQTIRAALTWEKTLMSFTEVPLREVALRFNRHNATQLVLGDAELGERKIGGTLALDQVDAFIGMLEQEGEIAVDRRTPGRIVLQRAH